ncbi:hypothetical protein C4D60_Mb03t12820 [Musa balbisiana]|uniref:Uncharacterized protein n=1 Tax=Musa balbisiana TaxID=52838 RepID=A0A4V4H626_MUSBA|nr:hypothetical protein C4D60_Mb03t12820 [Musa balbisiana]
MSIPTMFPRCNNDFCRKGKQKRKLSGSIWNQAGCLMLSLKVFLGRAGAAALTLEGSGEHLRPLNRGRRSPDRRGVRAF